MNFRDKLPNFVNLCFLIIPHALPIVGLQLWCSKGIESHLTGNKDLTDNEN